MVDEQTSKTINIYPTCDRTGVAVGSRSHLLRHWSPKPVMLILKCCTSLLFYSLFPLAVFSGAAAFPLQRTTSRFACLADFTRDSDAQQHQCSCTWIRVCTRRLGAHPHTPL